MICLARVCGANVEVNGSGHGASGGVPFCRITEIGKSLLVANVGGSEASGSDVIVEGIFDAIGQAIDASFEPGITQGLMLASSGDDTGIVRGGIVASGDFLGECRPSIPKAAFAIEFLAYWGRVQFELEGSELIFQDVHELLFPVVTAMFADERALAIRTSSVFPFEREGSSCGAVGRVFPRSVAGGGEGATEIWMAKAQRGRGTEKRSA